jgi:riboflavin kinase, archaea type
LEEEEYGGIVSINIVPCRIFAEDAVILRTDSNESGEGTHPKTLIEVACEIRLRDKYQLKDGDIVHIEVERDE